MILALLVLAIIVGCLFAVGFTGLMSYDILKRLFTGKPIEIEDIPINEKNE
jgi:hypothetical protein